MVIFSPSVPTDFELRMAIRKTWAKDFISDREKSKFLFFLAKTGLDHVDKMVLDESKEFEDLLVMDFRDSYFNISLKVGWYKRGV